MFSWMLSNQGYRRCCTASILFVAVFLFGANVSFSDAKSSNPFFNAQSSSDNNVTSLMNSAMDGDALTTQVLINSGVDVNAKNIGGATALHIAARANNVDVIETLIKNGAKVDVRDNDKWTPLMRACLSGNKDAVNVLLDNDASIWLENRWDETALIHSSVSNCEECIEDIIEKVDVAVGGIDEKSLKKINAQIDESISIFKKKQNKNAEEMLVGFSEILNAEVGKIDGEKKKEYKLKDDEKLKDDDGKKKEYKLKESDEKLKDGDEKIIAPPIIVDMESGASEGVGRKVDKSGKMDGDKSLKSDGVEVKSAEVEPKSKSVKSVQSEDGGDVINLNEEDWKNKKDLNDSVKVEKEELVESEKKVRETEKLFIFTGDEKKSSEKVYDEKFDEELYNREQESEIFDQDFKSYELNPDDGEVINLNSGIFDDAPMEAENSSEKKFLFLGR